MLTSAINKLRKALGGDRQSPRYIQTIPKKGYRLIADISIPEPVSGDEPLPTPKARPDPSAVKKYRWNVVVIVIAVLAALFLILSPSTIERQQSTIE